LAHLRDDRTHALTPPPPRYPAPEGRVMPVTAGPHGVDDRYGVYRPPTSHGGYASPPAHGTPLRDNDLDGSWRGRSADPDDSHATSSSLGYLPETLASRGNGSAVNNNNNNNNNNNLSGHNTSGSASFSLSHSVSREGSPVPPREYGGGSGNAGGAGGTFSSSSPYRDHAERQGAYDRSVAHSHGRQAPMYTPSRLPDATVKRDTLPSIGNRPAPPMTPLNAGHGWAASGGADPSRPSRMDL
jgi:hypothetical protein